MSAALGLCLAAGALGCGPAARGARLPPQATPVRWGISYGAIEAKDLADYDVLIVEPSHAHTAAELRERGARIVLAYLSVGEVAETAHYFSALKRAGALAERNPRWNSWSLDLTKPAARRILSGLAKHWIDLGYDGLMLDTLDAAMAPVGGQGIVSEVARNSTLTWLAELRAALPEALLVPNGGFAILPEHIQLADAWLVESAFEEGRRSKPERDHIQAMLRRARRRVPVLVLEYIQPGDQRQRACRLAARSGVTVHFAQLALQQLRSPVPCASNRQLSDGR